MHIAIIWQRLLPYHVARIRAASEKLNGLGHRLTAIEVASRDASYPFPQPKEAHAFEHVCCFPGECYHSHSARTIFKRVYDVLTKKEPDVVFAPATPFPEGMAAVSYRLYHGKKLVMMDDAFERTDKRPLFVRLIKKAIHRNIDAVFVPAASHQRYYFGLGFPPERIFYGVDVVDNDFFSDAAEQAGQDRELRGLLGLPPRYFLFVGRRLERKGLVLLVEAFRKYRVDLGGSAWDLVIVGTGDLPEDLCGLNGIDDGIHLAGPKFGRDLSRYFALAGACVVPSYADPWALVVNEAMASGVPVIVSRGCGASMVLVGEAENGWTFEPGDSDGLKRLLLRITHLEDPTLRKMGRRSREIVSEWGLERFTEGVLAASAVPRRSASGLFSRAIVSLWKGRVGKN